MHYQGHPPFVQVTRKDNPLEAKAREVLLGREVVAVYLSDGYLTLHLDDGGEFRVYDGQGFREVN